MLHKLFNKNTKAQYLNIQYIYINTELFFNKHNKKFISFVNKKLLNLIIIIINKRTIF